ncbi:DUF3519 domain-containing protein, partial [Helicobacter pylori]
TKPLTDQEDLLKNTELENETTQEATKLSPLEQANAEKHELTLKTMQKMHKTKHKTKLYKDSVAHRKTLAKSQNSN